VCNQRRTCRPWLAPAIAIAAAVAWCLWLAFPSGPVLTLTVFASLALYASLAQVVRRRAQRSGRGITRVLEVIRSAVAGELPSYEQARRTRDGLEAVGRCVERDGG
jgi:hypothetical protein